MPPNPTSGKFILILSSHLCLGLPSGSFRQVSLPKPCIRLSCPSYVLYVPPISFFQFNHPNNIGWAVHVSPNTAKMIGPSSFVYYNFFLLRWKTDNWKWLIVSLIFTFLFCLVERDFCCSVRREKVGRTVPVPWATECCERLAGKWCRIWHKITWLISAVAKLPGN